MNWFPILRFLHIGSAMLFIGGVVARQILRSSSEKTDDLYSFVVLSQAVSRIEDLMVIPGMLGVILFGILLALTSGTPILGFLQGGSRNWLLVSIILLLIMVLTVPLTMAQRGKQFELAKHDALAKGAMTDQLRAELNNSTVRLLYLMQIGLPLIIVILMVFKPF